MRWRTPEERRTHSHQPTDYVGFMARPHTRVLVTDLDNTLWDWFAAWYASFSSMLQVLVEDSGVPRDVLEDEMRDLHRKYGTTEYSNLLSEVPSLIEAAEGVEPWRAYPRAVDALRRERRSNTRLYPSVRDSLLRIKAAGIPVIAYTESLAYWTIWRIKKTGLDGVIDVLYSAPDHDLPRGQSFEEMRMPSRPDSHYALQNARHEHVPRGVTKPDAEVLLSILAAQGAEPSEAVYIGDSLMKDIAMAQAAGVTDVHAKYGEVLGEPGYDLLRRVTHWSDQDVARERALASSAQVRPSHTCVHQFAEVLPVLGLDGGS